MNFNGLECILSSLCLCINRQAISNPIKWIHLQNRFNPGSHYVKASGNLCVEGSVVKIKSGNNDKYSAKPVRLAKWLRRVFQIKPHIALTHLSLLCPKTQTSKFRCYVFQRGNYSSARYLVWNSCSLRDPLLSTIQVACVTPQVRGEQVTNGQQRKSGLLAQRLL